MSGPGSSPTTAGRFSRVVVLAIASLLLIGAFSGIIGPVRASDGSLSPPHSERAFDSDSPPDGLYNTLIVNVSVDVTVGGIFYVTGELRDNGGSSLIESRFTAAGLSTGLQAVRLKFTGYLIRASGFLGPYQVNIGLFDDSFHLLDVGTYMTKGYLPSDFQTLPAIISPPHSDYTIDADADTLDDFLITTVNVDVDIPEWYQVEATLFDNSGVFPITSVENETLILTGSQQVDVTFIGYSIRLSGFDGPYRVELRLYDASHNLLDTDMHFTNPYFSGNFEPAPAAFLPPHSDRGLDLNSNSLFEYLVVTAYVAVFVEGTYHVSGMSPFGLMENHTYLTTGIHPVNLQYIGFLIVGSGADGPYAIELELRDDYNNLLDADPHITSAYDKSEFEPKPPGFFDAPHWDYGLDTDADTKFNYLVVMANVTIEAPGFYEISGELYDSMDMNKIIETSNATWLDAGHHTVYVAFDGITIHLSRSNGPYGVYLAIYDGLDYFLEFDTLDTRTYSYTDFDMPPAVFTPPHGDYGLDTDFPPDGLFNFLAVNASLQVKDGGWYLLYGALLDSSFEPITQAQGFSNMSIGPGLMQLQFNGLNISRSGMNGPYVVVMDLYYFEGQLPVRVDWDVHFTAPYDHSDFMAPAPATIWGYVYNEADLSPVNMAQISVMNYTYGWIGHAQTNSTGYYELEAFDGDFCVLIDGQDLQSNITLTSVAGSAEVSRYLEPSIPNEMDTNLVFLDWNYIGLDSTISAVMDNRSTRFMIDIVVGNRDGYVDQNELDLFATFMAGSETAFPMSTEDHLLVDGIHYDLVPGSDVLTIDALGPVVSPNPAYMHMSANFTSNATIPASTIHWLEWNVSYDNEEEAGAQHGLLPTGYSLWGYIPATNVSVSGIGSQNVVIDPHGDWNESDEYDNVWVNLTIGQGPPDSQAPQSMNVMVDGLSSQTYGLTDIPPLVYLNATVDDTSSGNVPIGGANYTIGAQNWASSTPMSAIDGSFDSSTEGVTALIVPLQYSAEYCVYGWDILQNGDTTGACASITITDDMSPQIHNIQFSSSTFFLSSAPPATTLTATVDDTVSGNSIITGANYTTSSSDSWPGTPMIAVDGSYNEPAEDIAANVPIPSLAGVFDYYVHAWDSNLAYNDSALPVQITVIDDIGPAIVGLQLNGQSSPSVLAGASVLVDAMVDDTGGRGDTFIQGANYTIDGDWGTSAAMFAADGTYDSPTENVIITINTNGWSDGDYQICVYGWDSFPNYNVTGACASLNVYSVDDEPPNVSNVLLDGYVALTVQPGSMVNLTARVHDTGSMTSDIGSANYSVGSIWPGVAMNPLDGTFDSVDEVVYGVINTSGWADGTYQVCVHGSDSVPNHHVSFDACADLTIQTPPDSQSPTIENEAAVPSTQTSNGFVRISANINDNQQVDVTRISIVGPVGGLIGNYTMNYDGISGEYYYSDRFSEMGTHTFTIWASDVSGNWESASGSFEIVQSISGPSFVDQFWWIIIIIVTCVLVVLLMVWRTKPSDILPESEEESPLEAPPAFPSDDSELVAHSAPVEEVETESMVKCLSCGTAALLAPETDLLTTQCTHCGSMLLEVAKGYNYLIVDEDPGVAFNGFKSILKKEIPGLCISTTFPEKLGRRYDVEGADLYWLTDTVSDSAVKALNPKRLDFEMMRAISNFLRDHPEGTVMIDGIENLIVENGFDSVFRFIKKVNDLASMGGATIFVPLSPSSLGKDELAVLQKEFDRVQILPSTKSSD
jgi:hypothetical protein